MNQWAQTFKISSSKWQHRLSQRATAILVTIKTTINRLKETPQRFDPLIPVLWIGLGIYCLLFLGACLQSASDRMTLERTISRLTKLATEPYTKLALERIPLLQYTTKTLNQPTFFNPLSIFYTFYPPKNEFNTELLSESRFLVLLNKQNLFDLNLNGIHLENFEKSNPDFRNSHFRNVSFIRANLNHNSFVGSKFIGVDFWGASLQNSDFAFSIFERSDLQSADLRGSNLCGVKLINTDYANTDLRGANLIGVDLSNRSLSHHHDTGLPKLQGAYYNSKPLSSLDSWNSAFLKQYFPTCRAHNFQTTTFPPGFDPEKHGMIDPLKDL